MTNEIITFTTGQVRATHTIIISQDDICEDSPNENFFIALNSDLPMINLIDRRTQIIIDDSAESECSKCTYYYIYIVMHEYHYRDGNSWLCVHNIFCI